MTQTSSPRSRAVSANAGGNAEGTADLALRTGWPAGLLRDVRDALREDAKARQTRAGQVAAGAACAAALCRGQALAFAAAAEYIDAVLAAEHGPDAQA